MISIPRIVKPVFEFLLWDNCKNHCKFCYQKMHYKCFSYQEHVKSCNLVKQFIDSDKYINNSHVLLVGGELFDDEMNFSLIDDLTQFVIEKMICNSIDLLYINTNLIYRNTSCLFRFLKNIKDNNLFDRLKFTTSYDIAGRYSSDFDRQTVLDNLSVIKKEFPQINIVVNSIMTKQFCEDVISGKFSIKSFCQTYDVKVNTLPYINFNNEFLASKLQIFTSLMKINNEMPGFIDAYVYDMDIKQEKILNEYYDSRLNSESSKMSSCGHSVNFKKYSNDDSCFVCDLKRMFR